MSETGTAAAFATAIAELGAIHARIANITRDVAEGWRHDLIAQRRLLQAKIGEVSALLGHHADEDEIRALRDALNRMRSKVALHQANWPAVRIDLVDPDYRASVQDVRVANSEFTGLAERLAGTLDR